MKAVTVKRITKGWVLAGVPHQYEWHVYHGEDKISEHLVQAEAREAALALWEKLKGEKP